MPELLHDKNIYRKIPYSAFAASRLKVLAKDKRLVPFTYNPAQQSLIDNLTERDLVLKARQLGMSTAIQGMLYQEAVTGTATTMTLAHDDDGTQKLRRIADRFHRNDPTRPQRGAANARLTTYPDRDSEALIATAGNRASGRAATLSHLHGSEVAFWPDAESIVAGAIQAGEPRVILESTPNGAQGYFYSLCMEALDGANDWRLHFYPWWWEPGYRTPLTDGEALAYTDDEQALVAAHNLTAEQIKWRRGKQRELKTLFIQEYPEDPRSCFLRSGYGYFGDLSGVFTAPMDPTPDEARRYVAGLDFGQTIDYTALSIIDATARVQVARLRIKGLPWAEMRRQVIALCKRWGVKLMLAEANSMGSTNIEELRSEMSTQGFGIRLEAFDTTNDSKASIMGALHETLHQKDGLKLQDDPIQRHELGAFQAVQLPSGAWRLAATGGEHDDTVVCLALSWSAVVHRPKAQVF